MFGAQGISKRVSWSSVTQFSSTSTDADAAGSGNQVLGPAGMRVWVIVLGRPPRPAWVLAEVKGNLEWGKEEVGVGCQVQPPGNRCSGAFIPSPDVSLEVPQEIRPSRVLGKLLSDEVNLL